MIIAVTTLVLLFLIVYIFMKQPPFGALPSGKKLEEIKQSKNYSENKFQNLSFTPDLSEGATYFSVSKQFFFQRSKRRIPQQRLPTSKTNLHQLSPKKNVLIWFGHSSCFMQVDGKKILVDPVLSGAASPLSFTTRSFEGTDVYSIADIPSIDYLFISHDHWDHLDYRTIKELQCKVGKVICGLGVGDHFTKWGYQAKMIFEKDWDEELELEKNFVVNTVSARHFSGRGFKRNQSLWLSYAFSTPSFKIFIGGDSGYDSHFKNAGELFGPFDIAILECGQYDLSWKYIHMLPYEVLQAAKDLKTKHLLPVHWAKFALANHDWDTPIKTLTKLNEETKIPLLTPKIGEEVLLGDDGQKFEEWWLQIK